MFKSREQLERDEHLILSPFAVKSGESLGRVFRERAHAYRTEFQRDRARIIHSTAFRRLDGKTQVFLNGTGDHFRTRLTHTIEVASISRTIARALGLNEDLAEAIALAHDLGHSPFGHAGEEELDRVMKPYGGFDHNAQSLRVVELIEEKYPGHAGLNLSYEVLEGIRKHDSSHRLPDGSVLHQPSLEAQVADYADEITYYSHDLDDGLDSGLLKARQLESVPVWVEAVEEATRQARKIDPLEQRGFVIRCLINAEVEDLVGASESAIRRSKVQSVDEVRRCPKRLIGFSPARRRKNAQLRKFLYQNFYYHAEVAGVHREKCGLLDLVFNAYCENPKRLGKKATKRIEKQGLHRTVADYLAGMTDRFLLKTAGELMS